MDDFCFVLFPGFLFGVDGSDERRAGQSLRRGLLDRQGRGRRHLRRHRQETSDRFIECKKVLVQSIFFCFNFISKCPIYKSHIYVMIL